MADVVLESLVKIFGGTADELSTANLVLPEHMIAYETDTAKMKIGDGDTAWNDLPYTVSNALSDTEYEMIENAGASNGFALLDGSGLLPLDQLPDAAKSHVVYKADIAARDEVPEEDRISIYVVLDASADPTVEGSYATYVWDTENAEWIKLSEGESLDVDFSVFFDKTTETLDAIDDGTNYVRFTPEERTRLENAIINTDRLILNPMSISDLDAYLNPSED